MVLGFRVFKTTCTDTCLSLRKIVRPSCGCTSCLGLGGNLSHPYMKWRGIDRGLKTCGKVALYSFNFN